MAFLYCDRSGVISLGKYTPSGMLPLGKGCGMALTEAVERVARKAKGSDKWLVPGIPEAETDEEALEAAVRFHALIADRLKLLMKGGA